MKGIVIGTTLDRQDWLSNFTKSLHGQTKYPVVAVYDYGFQLACIKKGAEIFDEFLFLEDTWEIKNFELLDTLFEKHEGKSVALSDCPLVLGMYAGKLLSKFIKQMDIPEIKSKYQAVTHEIWFAEEYAKLDPNIELLFTDLRDGEVYEEKFGRKNMILENDYLKKFKGTWTLEMAQ